MTQRKTFQLYLKKQRTNDFRDDAIKSFTRDVESAVVTARATSDVILVNYVTSLVVAMATT
jgi:hypothetical protein